MNSSNKSATLYFEQGQAAVAAKNWQEAIACFNKALIFQPNSAEIYNNLGGALIAMDNLDGAEACLLKATSDNPYALNAYYNLGFVYKKKRNFNKAIACFRHILEIDPDWWEVENTLGVVLESAYRPDEAEICYRHVLSLAPSQPETYYNLGNLLRSVGRLSEAEPYLRRACELAPSNDYKFHTGLAFFYLLLENYEVGWNIYAQAIRHIPNADRPLPQWNGENLTEKKILLSVGGGFGDTLQFIRFAPQVAALAKSTTIWVQEPLQKLLAANYPELSFIDEQQLSIDYDFICSLQKLPIVFRPTETTIPYHSGYLRALSADRSAWQERLGKLDGGKHYRVGVVWSGNIKNPMDHFRSIPFAELTHLFTVPRISWFSLQAGPHAKDYEPQDPPFIDLSAELTDFAQTAAIMENLDLVITTDTSVAHLAGALGKKTWLLLDANSDWRWLLARSDSPWYDSLRLFRQQKNGDWPNVIRQITAALQQEVSAKIAPRNGLQSPLQSESRNR